MSSTINTNLISVLQGVRQVVSEQVGVVAPIQPEMAAMPKRRAKKVIFDKSTENPFEVVFSERGFLIGETRMSFEDLETAISKNYSIVLNGGKGLQLDAVKMQKILKYKDVQ